MATFAGEDVAVAVAEAGSRAPIATTATTATTAAPAGAAESIFVLGGGRESVTATRMEQLLAQVDAAGGITDPVAIRLSDKSFTIPAAEIIARRLRTFKNLKTVDISDIIAGLPEDEALQVLSIIAGSLEGNAIVELNISDNALGSKGVLAIKNLMVLKTLEVHEYI
jgi:Ran GTPase-activating protein 1